MSRCDTDVFEILLILECGKIGAASSPQLPGAGGWPVAEIFSHTPLIYIDTVLSDFQRIFTLKFMGGHDFFCFRGPL